MLSLIECYGNFFLTRRLRESYKSVHGESAISNLLRIFSLNKYLWQDLSGETFQRIVEVHLQIFKFSSRILLLSLANLYTSRLLNRKIQRRTHLTRARIRSSSSNSPQKLHFQPLITRDEGVEIEPEFRPIFMANTFFYIQLHG